MPGHDIIVIGGSAGAVEGVVKLARALPGDLPASLFVVIHFPAHSTSALPRILSRVNALEATHAQHGEEILRGRIYVAPPDRHMMLRRGTIALPRGPKENGHRPAIDPLFRSAARAYGRRVVGVVLSGNLDDGTAGLFAIKSRGGVAIVQDPDEALYPGMPHSAVNNVRVDHVLPVDDIASKLVALVSEPVEEEVDIMPDEDMEKELEIAEFDEAMLQSDDRPGTVSVFTCPECHGSLWALADGQLMRFRCRVGHAYSADSLLVAHSESVEAALWVALRALEESAALHKQLSTRAERRGIQLTAERFREHMRDAEHRAAVIREVLVNGRGIPATAPDIGERAVEDLAENAVGAEHVRGSQA